MPRSSLSKWIIGIGIVGLIFLNPFISAQYFNPIILIGMFIAFALPVVLVGLVWLKIPKGLWVSSILYSWAILVGSTFMLSLAVSGFSFSLSNFIQVFVGSITYGTVWLAEIMVPVGIIYWATRNRYRNEFQD